MSEIIPLSVWRAHIINCFLLRGSQGYILVDTGLPGSDKSILEQITSLGIDPKEIKLIIITHCHVDHYGSAAKLKKLLQVPVLGHALDLPYYQTGGTNKETLRPTKWHWKFLRRRIIDLKLPPVELDIVMGGSASYDLQPWGLAGRIIPTPGHTPGSLSVVLDNGEAIIMDMMSTGVFMGGIFWHRRVKHPAFHHDLDQLRQSFDRLLAENIHRFYLGHGKPANRQQVERYYHRYLS